MRRVRGDGLVRRAGLEVWPRAQGGGRGVPHTGRRAMHQATRHAVPHATHHAIHHAAILKPIFEAVGVELPAEFGRAPSTVNHEQPTG